MPGERLQTELDGNAPLVSVGLPTYSRVSKLRRAVDSVLAQDYPNVELIISDDASRDETEAYCLELARREERVRYVRQPANVGLSANYAEVLNFSRGKFFMWLSDDDWLDPHYISECLRFLLAHPDYSSVCGRAKYFQEGRSFHEHEVDLLGETGPTRVLSFYRNVGRNNSLYGLMRRETLNDFSMRNALGGDWFVTAAVAQAGKIKILDSVHINRNCEGVSEDLKGLARTLRLSGLQSFAPYLSLPLNAFKETAWLSPAFRSLGMLARLTLATRVAAIVFRQHTWHHYHYRYRLWKGRILAYAARAGQSSR